MLSLGLILTLKQPSASVNPDSQASSKVGFINIFILKFITFLVLKNKRIQSYKMS